jgi:uncharacterized protein YehS (DUF1456 family)
MINNDVLRSVRYMLNVRDEVLVDIVRLGGGEVTMDQTAAFLKNENEPGYQVCGDRVMAHFLDGLIIYRRGPREGAPRTETPISNNTVLKKLRVAFELKEDDLFDLMSAAGFHVSRPELSALFRAPAHKNFRPCGDQFLRNFLKSLSARLREGQ